MLKPWDWKLQQKGGGPNHYLTIWFESGTGQSLRRLFTQNVPYGYVANPFSTHSYCDITTAQKLLKEKQTDERMDVRYSDIVDIEDERVSATSVDGIGSLECVESLTEYVAALACNRSIQKWSITGGGRRYNPMVVAEGKGSASFLNYLSVLPVPALLPKFYEVHQPLIGLLERPSNRKLFRLGTFASGIRMCAFTLYLLEDVTDQVRSSHIHRDWDGWQLGVREVSALGRALSKQCHIPGPVPNIIKDQADRIRCDDGESVAHPVGFELAFGYWNQTGYDAPREL